MSEPSVGDELKAKFINTAFRLGHDMLDFANYKLQGNRAEIISPHQQEPNQADYTVRNGHNAVGTAQVNDTRPVPTNAQPATTNKQTEKAEKTITPARFMPA